MRTTTSSAPSDCGALSTAPESAAGNPLLLIGALELDRTRDDDKYRQFARRSVESLLKSQKPNGAMPGDTGDHGDVAAAAVTLFALQYDDDPLRAGIADAMRRYLEFCLARTDNPFGLSRQGIEEPEASFFHPTVGMGVNFWILSRAWAALLVHQLTHDPRALVYATDQIDWVLGKNPLDLCMFEGHGGLNPPRYHHRYNMIAGHERGAVPGAIPNGMVRDMGIVDRPGFRHEPRAATARRRSAPASRGWCTTCSICWPPARSKKAWTSNRRVARCQYYSAMLLSREGTSGCARVSRPRTSADRRSPIRGHSCFWPSDPLRSSPVHKFTIRAPATFSGSAGAAARGAPTLRTQPMPAPPAEPASSPVMNTTPKKLVHLSPFGDFDVFPPNVGGIRHRTLRVEQASSVAERTYQLFVDAKIHYDTPG